MDDGMGAFSLDQRSDMTCSSPVQSSQMLNPLPSFFHHLLLIITHQTQTLSFLCTNNRLTHYLLPLTRSRTSLEPAYFCMLCSSLIINHGRTLMIPFRNRSTGGNWSGSASLQIRVVPFASGNENSAATSAFGESFNTWLAFVKVS